jgi:tRNA (guanine-N7-)-methyltransferase
LIRAIRSYVLRQGRTTSAQSRALQELFPRFGLSFSHEHLDRENIFGRKAPLVLEIGSGMGETTAAIAAAHPEADFLAVEVHGPGVGSLLNRLAAQELANVRVIRHDAVEVLQHMIPDATLAALHLFFPDPWPKKRHHKRRLIQAPFVELLAQTIAPGGTLRLATDWEQYAQQMRDVIDASSKFVNVAADAGFVARSAERALTRFERRGQRLGHGVWDLEYRRMN